MQLGEIYNLIMVCSELTKIIEHYNIFERGVLAA